MLLASPPVNLLVKILSFLFIFIIEIMPFFIVWQCKVQQFLKDRETTRLQSPLFSHTLCFEYDFTKEIILKTHRISILHVQKKSVSAETINRENKKKSPMARRLIHYTGHKSYVAGIISVEGSRPSI